MIYSLLHTLLVKFVSLFAFWIPEVVERKKFELKNLKERGAQSFKTEKVKADFCFEFSSEGEFAQIASLVEDALKAGRKIELVMFSPSVEKQVLALYSKYPEQIRYLRYPILTYNFLRAGLCFTKWISAPTLFLVRYDFFPEFLSWAKNEHHQLKLLWLSFKKNRLKNQKLSWMKRQFLSLSTQNIFATEEDRLFALSFGFEGTVYDFRMEQIYRRKINKEARFQDVFKNYQLLMNHLNTFSRKLIVGNAWVNDVGLLQDLDDQTGILIVPHKLDEKNLFDFTLALEKLGLDSQIVDDSTTDFSSSVLILNKKGVLCELYSDFHHAYVGGGFGVSVHSILEPLVSGVGAISCGPVHHRSTEFDIAARFGVMTEVRNHQGFFQWFSQSARAPMSFDPESYKNFRKEVIGC